MQITKKVLVTPLIITFK